MTSPSDGVRVRLVIGEALRAIHGPMIFDRKGTPRDGRGFVWPDSEIDSVLDGLDRAGFQITPKPETPETRIKRASNDELAEALRSILDIMPGPVTARESAARLDLASDIAHVLRLGQR